MIFLTIVAVIVIFSLLVLIHEWGHFAAARRSGIRVLEFGVGFPPRIFGKKVGETMYTINAIPFGGFVKLYGEDTADPAALKNPRSFAGQSRWVRAKVVFAGVFMNFVLAVALLTVGFMFGIEPLLVTENDLFHHLAAGNVRSAPGVYVAKVSKEAASAGILVGDEVFSIDDKPIRSADSLSVLQKGGAVKDIDVTVRSFDAAGKPGELRKIHLPLTSTKKYFGIDLKPYTDFPRLTVLEVKKGSVSEKAGLQRGDVILSMNGEEIYSQADFEAMVIESQTVRFSVLRSGVVVDITVVFPQAGRVVIADVFHGSAAQEAGFLPGDVIVRIDGVAVSTPQQVQETLKANKGKSMAYALFRNNREVTLRASAGEKNLLGVALSMVSSYRNAEISIYRDLLLTSITEIKKVRYAPWKSFTQAVSESVRLTGITIQAFGRTLRSIVSNFSVPAEIGGPVQIAYYTHTFVQEGFFALLRFTALLSLSLAVINVLPIPALDGGRLLFIAIEAITGRRVNARVEAAVHGIGFALLLLLIFLVTWSDISKLF